MSKIFLLGLVLISVAGMANAQDAGDRRGWGYVFAAPGGTCCNGAQTTLHVGGGGEGLLKGGFGAGAEVGYLTPTRDFGNGTGLASANLGYHFVKRNSDQRLVPFVTGGASLAFRDRARQGGGNFGGGVQYWLGDHAALRVEFRNHIFSSDSFYQYGFRVGIAFK